MVLLYLVAGSVLLFLASADEGHSPDTYPNPMLDYDYSRCRREAKSYICDPDGVISKDEGQLSVVNKMDIAYKIKTKLVKQ